MAKSKLVGANEKIAEKIVGGYTAIEEGVVGGYKKVEETVVGSYRKIEDAFVDRYLTRDGESVEDAKARLHAEQEKRRAQGQYDSHAAQDANCVRQTHKQRTEHVRQAQGMAHVPENQADSN